jgi:GNAT superfamily N-acetyltransferase
MTNTQIERQPEPPHPTPFGMAAPGITVFREASVTGDALAMRRLDEGDLPEIERHLLDLGRFDRATRFMGAPSDAAISAYARRLDPSAAIMIGGFARSGRLLGFAEAQPTDAEDTVEIAVTVAGDYRRKGLGKQLVARLVELALAGGASRAEFNFCPSNTAIVRLIASLGGQFGLPFGQASIRRPFSAKH